MSDLTLGNVFCPTPKHMIRLSVEYRQDSKIQIRLWKSLFEDTSIIFVFLKLQFQKHYCHLAFFLSLVPFSSISLLFKKTTICSFGFSWGQSLLISDVQQVQQQNCEMSTIIMTGLQELQLYYIQPQPGSILDLYPAVKLQLKERCSCVPVWLSGRALRLLCRRLWVRFPGNTCTNGNV